MSPPILGAHNTILEACMTRTWKAALPLAAALALGAPALAQAPAEAGKPKEEKAAIDQPVKTFKLVDIMKERKEGEPEDALHLDLAQYRDKKAVVLFFMSYTCPVTWRYEKRVGALMEKLGEDVAFVGVKSHAAETVEKTKQFAEARNFAMPVLYDRRNEVSNYFGVRSTPSFVLIDKAGRLRYIGAFDDNPDEKSVKNRYLADALEAVLNGRDVAVKRTVVPG